MARSVQTAAAAVNCLKLLLLPLLLLTFFLLLTALKIISVYVVDWLPRPKRQEGINNKKKKSVISIAVNVFPALNFQFVWSLGGARPYEMSKSVLGYQ